MHTASSAKRTCSELRSASEYTATEGMPSSLQAQMTRRAISPRLAMRILRNMIGGEPRLLLLTLGGTDGEQRLAILYRLAVFGQDPHDIAAHIRLDLVH